MSTGTDITGAAQSQVVSEIAARLRKLTGFESVHVIPIDFVGFDGEYDVDHMQYGSVPFAVRLGALAADHVSFELALSMLMKKHEDRHAIFKIGVAAGSTVRAIVKSFRMPARFPELFKNPRSDDQFTVEVSPLAIGPLPETASSTGFIASDLCDKLRQSLTTETPEEPY